MGRLSNRRRWFAGRFAGTFCVAGLCVSVMCASAYGAFGRDGKETLAIGSDPVGALAYPGSRVLLLGGFVGQGHELVRLRHNGSLDRSFGERGHVAIDFSDVAVQPNGKILTVATQISSSGRSSDTELVVTRLRRNGELDRSFGRGGEKVIDFGGRFNEATAVGIATDGRVMIGGTRATTIEERGGSDAVSMVGRLLPSGALDRSFSRNGLVALPTGVAIVDFAAGPRGSTLVATAYYSVNLFRLRAGGSLDSSFGDQGKVEVRPFDSVPSNSFFSPIKQIGVSHGRVIVVGTESTFVEGRTTYSMTVVRCLSDGTPDPSFGEDGIATVSFGKIASATAFAVRRNGGVVVEGRVVNSPVNGNDIRAVSFRSDGSLDRAFGGKGKVTVSFGGEDWPSGVVLQGSDTAILVGTLPGGRPPYRYRQNQTTLTRVPLGSRR